MGPAPMELVGRYLGLKTPEGGPDTSESPQRTWTAAWWGVWLFRDKVPQGEVAVMVGEV